jgi:hypothetical protein
MNDKPASDTPRTDREENRVEGPNPWSPHAFGAVPVDFSRTLERENARLQADLARSNEERDFLKKDSDYTLGRMGEVKAERDDARRKLAAAEETLALHRGWSEDSVKAVSWMHDDPSLGLKVGDTLTTDGVEALHNQRDDLRQRLAAAERERDEAKARLNTVLIGDEEGGLQSWIQKHDKNMLRFAEAIAELKSRADAERLLADRLAEALKEIEKGEGQYNRDQLTHASNTIEAMTKLATKALSLHAAARTGGRA